jgi:hypothetical protein
MLSSTIFSGDKHNGQTSVPFSICRVSSGLKDFIEGNVNENVVVCEWN